MRQKLLKYQQLQKKMEIMNSRREIFLNRMMEIESTLEALENIKNREGSEIMIPLGSGIYISGKLGENNKLLMVVGGNVAKDISLEEAKKTVEEYRQETEATIHVFEDEMMKYAEELSILQPEVKSLVEKSR